MNKRPLRRRLALTLTASLLASCATLSPPQTAVPTLGADIPQSWLLTATQPPKGTALSSWRAVYDDPILLDYLQRAADANFDIRIAQSRVLGAQADLARSAARLKPRFDASASATGSAVLGDIDDPFDSYGLGLSGRWDPDVFGQTQTIIDGSRAALAVQQALSDDTRQAVLATTARAYIRAVEATMQVALAKTNLDFLTESRRISEARYRVGDTAKGDFSFAEANYQSALAGYESTLQSARAAKRALSIVLGDYPVEDITLAENLRDPMGLPSAGLPAQTLENRPDIIAARAQLAGRVASLQGAKLARWPSLDISGGLSSGSTFSSLFDPADYAARLGAGLSQVIFDGGAIQSGIDGAQADLDQAVMAYEQRLRRAMGEITDAYDRADTLQRTLVNLQASSEAANEALRLESIQYDLGESSLLDVLQVQTRVNNIDASLIRSQAALIETIITANEAVAGFDRL